MKKDSTLIQKMSKVISRPLSLALIVVKFCDLFQEIHLVLLTLIIKEK